MHDPLQELLVLHLFLGSCCTSQIEYCLIMFDWSTKQSGFFLSLIDKWKKIISIIIFGREREINTRRLSSIKMGFPETLQPAAAQDWECIGNFKDVLKFLTILLPLQISHNFIASANFSQFYCLCKFDKSRVIRNPFNLCTQPFNFTKLCRNEQWTRNPMWEKHQI